MRLQAAILDFYEYLVTEKDCSRWTIACYQCHLGRFLNFAGNIKVNTIDLKLVRRYGQYLTTVQTRYNRPLSARGRQLDLAILRSMLKYLNRRGVDSLFGDLVELPKAPPPKVDFLTREEIMRLLDTPDTSNILGLRDRAVLELLFSTGMRISEALNLNKDQIDFNTCEVMVRGKGQKDRPVFISQRAARWLRQYLNARNDSYNPLFIRHGRIAPPKYNPDPYMRISRATAARFITDYAQAADIKKHVSLHSLRRAFATDLLANGADLRSVQRMLGHALLTTTQRYTHVTDPQLKEVHERFHAAAAAHAH